MNLKKVSDKMYSQLVRDEIDGEVIYSRKLKVYPWLREDGSINWKNALLGGSIKRLIFPLLFLLLIAFAIMEYHNNFQMCQTAISYYNAIHQPLPKVNLSNLNFTNITYK